MQWLVGRIGSNGWGGQLQGPWLSACITIATGFFCRTGHYELWFLLLHGCYWQPCFSSLFWAVPLYVSALLVWVKWNWSGTSVQCSQRVGKLVAHITLPFLMSVTLTGEFPFGTEQCWLGGWDNADKIKLSFFFCVQLLSIFFVLLCCWEFFKWAPDLFHSCFTLWITV